MTQQPGMKRAQKVLKRKQAKAREERKSNIKQAIYAFEKAMKEDQAEKPDAEHAGHDHSRHDHSGHDHSEHKHK